MELRVARSDDIGFIVGLAGRLAEVSRLSWLPTGAIDRFAQSGCDAAAAAIGHPNQLVAVAEDGTERLGFVHACLDTSAFTGETVGYLATLAVATEATRRGVGRALTDAAESWAHGRGCSFMTLEVFASNDQARTVYSRLGYTEQTLKMAKRL